MKIKLLFAFIALSLASCSSDDDSGKDPSVDNGERKLDKIVQTEFNDDGSVKATAKTHFDDSDRAVLQLEYDGAGALAFQSEFTYNASGQLEKTDYFRFITTQKIAESSKTISYDESGRVTAVNESFKHNGNPATSVTSYHYNANNTIIATADYSYGSTVTTTYTVNANGQVYKKTDTAGAAEEILYDGQNILTYTNGSNSSNFIYDTTHTPKGQHHATILNQYKGNITNAVLLGGFTSIALGKTKYATGRTDSNGDKYTYNYDFDSEDYPVKVRYFKNEGSMPFSIREISYK